MKAARALPCSRASSSNGRAPLISANRSNALARASSLCSSSRGRVASLVDVKRSVAVATFGLKSDAALPGVDRVHASAGESSALEDRKVDTTAPLESLSGERPFPSIRFAEASAPRVRAISPGALAAVAQQWRQ